MLMNKKSVTSNNREEEFLSTTPETIYFGRHEVKLSRAARLMRSLNRLDIPSKPAYIRDLGITPTIALEGSDELAGEVKRTLNAAAFRPLEFPEGTTNAFGPFEVESSDAAKDLNRDGSQKKAFLPLAGTTFSVSGNISLEGVRTFAAGDLRDEKLLHTARPVSSLMEAGASLSMVANAGEMLGLLAPGARGFTIRGGSPVNPLYPDTAPEAMSPFDASAAAVAVGAVGAALVLGRGSDIASAAIRSGMTGYRPSLGIFTSTEGFVHSWRYAGWGAICRDAIAAAAFMSIAALKEGVSEKPGCGPWELPGYRPMLMGTDGVAGWRHDFMVPVAPKRVLFSVGTAWKTPERFNEIQRIAKGFADQGVKVDFIPDLPEEAPEIEWLSWAEFGPVLENYFERAFPLEQTIRSDRFLMLLTLSDRVKKVGFAQKNPLKNKRFVELVRREPELLSPWAGTLIRNRVMPLKARFESLFRGHDRPDAVVWFGGSEAVDMAEGAVFGVPFFNDEAKGEIAGAFVFGAPRDDARTLGAASLLESLRSPEFDALLGRLTLERPENVIEKTSADEHKAEPEEEDCDTALLKGLAGLSDRTSIFIPKESIKSVPADADAGDTADEAPIDSEEFAEHLKNLVNEFHKALEEAAEDDKDLAESAAAASSILLKTLTTGEEPKVDVLEPEKAPKPAPAALPAVSPEDAAWLNKFLPGSIKRCPEIAREKFLREIFTEPMPGEITVDDGEYLLQFAKYWIFRHERHKALRVLERIPEGLRSFAVKENIVLGLFLDPDIKPAIKAAEALDPSTDTERSAKEWLLGLGCQRMDDAEGAIAHFTKSHGYAPVDSPANFPLAHLLLEKEGPKSVAYQALKQLVKESQPTGYKLLLSDEERIEKVRNFEQDLLPELPSGIFTATLLLSGENLRLDKERFKKDLWSRWNLAITDRTPEDPNTFTFRIGYLTGSLKFESGKVPDTSLEQAARIHAYTRDAEALLLNHAGRINLRIEAGTTPLRDAASLFAQILASACRSNEPLGVHFLGALHPATYCIDASSPVKIGEFPTLSVVSIYSLSDFGTPYISTYGLTTLGHPEIELDLVGLPLEGAGMLVYALLEKMVKDEFQYDTRTIRFGLDPENMMTLEVRRAPGRNVATEVVLFTRKPEEESLPQA